MGIHTNDNRVVAFLAATKDSLDTLKEVVFSATTLALTSVACIAVLTQECANLTHAPRSLQPLSSVWPVPMCAGSEVQHADVRPGHGSKPIMSGHASGRGE